MEYNPDPNLFEINYRSPDNIAYLVARLEHTWGSERIQTLMKAARVILDQQQESNNA
jgi:hypothetical protein